MANLDLMYIIFTFNRPKAASICLNSLLNNTKVRPNEIWLLDDSSEVEFQQNLHNFALQNSTKECPINICQMGKNYGIGWAFGNAYRIIQWKDPKICGILESDYAYRGEWAEDVLATFDASENTIAITSDHIDMYNKEKYTNEFSQIMIKEFGEDIPNRGDYYKEFDLDTERGKITVKAPTNSCGNHFLHYHRLGSMLTQLDLGKPVKEHWNWFWNRIRKGCSGDDGTFWSASDGIISSTYTYFHSKWMKSKGLDLSKNFPWLVPLPSIAEHLASGGRNGNVGLPDGTTFIHAPSFPDDWQTWTRNKTNVPA